MPIGAAALVPAIVGAAGSIGGALIGSSATKGAANTLSAAGQQAIQNTQGITSQIPGVVATGQQGVQGATQQGQSGVAAGAQGANQILAQAGQQLVPGYSPYIDAGVNSLGSVQDLAGANGPLNQQFSFNPSNLQNDPGYQFTLQQGQQAIQRAAAAKGGLFSSGTLKSLAGYTTGTANQYFNDAFNRASQTFGLNQNQAMNRINTLQGLAGLGYGAQNNLSSQTLGLQQQQAQNTLAPQEFNASLGLQGAQGSANLGLQGTGQQLQGAQALNQALLYPAQAQAAGQIGQANAWSSGIGGIANSLAGVLAGRAANNNNYENQFNQAFGQAALGTTF